MKKIIKISLLILVFLPSVVFAQDDLDSLLNLQKKDSKEYIYATFKGSRIINGQSVERVPYGTLEFRISHRFGSVKGGVYDFFGMDQASERIGLEYGLTKFMTIGYGRSTIQKNFDGYTKIALLKQSTGKKSFPLTVDYYGSIVLTSLKWADNDRKNYFSSRLTYCNQLLIARKFNDFFSLQLTPTVIHKNLVPTELDRNTIPVIGAGARIKLTNRVAFTAEYFYVIPAARMSESEKSMNNAVGFGFDIDTGGHIFQIHFTNAVSMIEKGFMTETSDNFFKGQIHLGFNINRQFTLVQSKN
jgi:hypothetical protein